METVKRKINLKDFIEKFGKNELCIDKGEYTGSSYGFIPYNIRFKEERIPGKYTLDFPKAFDNMPFYVEKYDGTICTGITYGTYAFYYNWIRNFINGSKYYTPKKRKNDTIWSEITDENKFDLFSSCTIVLEILPEDIGEYECGISILCINESAEIFYKLFSVDDNENAIENANKFLVFDKILEGYPDAPNKEKYLLNPFVEIPVLIEEEIDEMGVHEEHLPEYINLNKNNFGDCYGETYKKGAYVVIKKGTYHSMLGSVEIERDSLYKRTNAYPNMTEIGGPFVIKYGESIIWEECFAEVTVYESETAFTESKLKYLVRDKISVDDNGENLDFVFSNNKCELKYSIGSPCNAVYNDKISAYTYDILTEIKIDDIPIANYNPDNHQVGDTGEIYFRYTVGNLISDINGAIALDSSGGGIEYEETYNYIILSKTFVINGTRYTKKYISIDYSTGVKPDDFDETKLYAIIKTTEREESGATRQFFVRNDKTIGFDEVSLTSTKINIDRGASASYEAFNVIGEVNSLDDIEKYHDDWFRIKGKND